MKNPKLEEENNQLKLKIEDLETEKETLRKFINDNYPSINDFQVKRGWYGNGTLTYKVIIDVFAEDITKLITYLTHKNLRGEKWSMIKRDIREQIAKEEK